VKMEVCDACGTASGCEHYPRGQHDPGLIIKTLRAQLKALDGCPTKAEWEKLVQAEGELRAALAKAEKRAEKAEADALWRRRENLLDKEQRDLAEAELTATRRDLKVTKLERDALRAENANLLRINRDKPSSIEHYRTETERLKSELDAEQRANGYSKIHYELRCRAEDAVVVSQNNQRALSEQNEKLKAEIERLKGNLKLTQEVMTFSGQAVEARAKLATACRASTLPASPAPSSPAVQGPLGDSAE
jgi:hypothetical protein